MATTSRAAEVRFESVSVTSAAGTDSSMPGSEDSSACAVLEIPTSATAASNVATVPMATGR